MIDVPDISPHKLLELKEKFDKKPAIRGFMRMDLVQLSKAYFNPISKEEQKLLSRKDLEAYIILYLYQPKFMREKAN